MSSRRRSPQFRAIALAVPAALAVSLLAGGCASSGSSSRGGAGPNCRILALSDGDIVSSALVDAVLFGHEGAQREPDMLTVVQFPLPEPGETAGFAQTEVSSCALGPPRFLEIAPDGMTAVVLASRGDAGEAPYEGKRMHDLSREGVVTLLDISGVPPESPGVLATLEVGPGALSMTFDAPRELLAVVRSFDGEREVVFARVSGRHGMWPLGRFPLLDLPGDSAVGPSTIAFNPDGSSVAVTMLGADQVWFFDVIDESGVIGLKKRGEPVGVPNFPMVASWTPDGAHLVVSCLGWGDAATHNIETAPAGQVALVRVGRAEGESHQVVTVAPAGVSPEGLTVSPDGRYAVTGNIRLSFLPESDPRSTNGGSLSLFAIDADAGTLAPLGEWECASAPQGLAFDPSGEFLFVTDFDNGSIQQWRIAGDALEFSGLSVGVGRGVHAVGATR